MKKTQTMVNTIKYLVAIYISFLAIYFELTPVFDVSNGKLPVHLRFFWNCRRKKFTKNHADLQLKTFIRIVRCRNVSLMLQEYISDLKNKMLQLLAFNDLGQKNCDSFGPLLIRTTWKTCISIIFSRYY